MPFEISHGPKAKVTRNTNGLTGKASIYPWEQMEAPFEAPDPETQEMKTWYSQFFVPGKTTKKFSGAAQNAGKKLGVTFKVTAAEEEGVEGVLVQRVEYKEPVKRTPEQLAALKAAREKKAATAKA